MNYPVQNTLLNAKLLQRIQSYLEVNPATPSAGNLAALVRAYTRKVPWESTSRIAKWAATDETADCPRWPEEFLE